jgi:hypothetical protein
MDIIQQGFEVIDVSVNMSYNCIWTPVKQLESTYWCLMRFQFTQIPHRRKQLEL